MKKCIVIAVFVLVLFDIKVSAYEIPEISGYNMFSETAQEISNGVFSIKPSEVFENIISAVTGEVKTFSKTAAVILVAALLSSTVSTMSLSLGGGAASDTAFFAFFSVIGGLALRCFFDILGYGGTVISNMTDFMGKFTPVIILTLFACCKTAGAAVFEPILSSAVFVISEVITHCLLPMVTFSAVLSVAGNIGDKNSISGFIKIVKSATKWIMALVITVFTGINTLYGFTTSALDAVGARTLKFAVGSLVPVVGGFLSDTLDTVAASGAVMKNAVGVSGIAVICVICVMPVIKIAVMQMMFKLIAAITEPIADKRICNMLWEVSDAISALFGIVALCAVMFIINICIILRFTA